jgi:uncharacterized protein
MKPLSITISPPDYQERTSMQTIFQTIADEVSVKMSQVEAAVQLLDDGATVPFIARYRKEVTQGLDDTQLRTLAERLEYLRELNKRRDSILNSIEEQGKLTSDLKERLQEATTRTALEDLYLPYKPKRRTKAQMAREAGLQALADALLLGDVESPENLAEQYLNAEHGVDTAQVALDGARQILMEAFAENADLMTNLREYLWEQGVLSSSVISGKETEGDKFKDYFTYEEAIKNIPSHRALALFRGRAEGILSLNLDVPVDAGLPHPCEAKVALAHDINPEKKVSANEKWLLDTVRRAWKVKIHSKLDIELKMRLRESAEQEAIRVFSNNLKDLLLAAPAGAKVTMGLDPGLRTGVKVAVVDFTGKLLDTHTIYPHAPRNQWDQSIETLRQLSEKHGVELVSIGNGTASRETDKLVGDLCKRYPALKLTKLVVSEAGASVYSASELAAKEFPELDVSLRGAVSIARRLQDPLAELVKIESKAIGVGQYQHDVNQVHLEKSLHAVVEDCVNAVGVDVNTASVPLLTEVAGLTSTLAENIVAYRDEHGAFTSRKQLQDVKRMGPKAFEQSAGFLRIRDGENPLDASAVHPEAYAVVERIAVKTELDKQALIGRTEVLKALNPAEFADDNFGIPTIKDILSELDKPGRDPRPEFVTANFREGVERLSDLEPGMVLEGVVSNVTNFGAFVDIGVHQDGLVHISQLADKFVQDPRDVVKAGDVVKVRVEEVDVGRKRIALTMRLNDQKKPQDNAETTTARKKAPKGGKRHTNQQAPVANNAIQEAFLKAGRGKR